MPDCRNCLTPLTDANWYPSRRNKQDYICKRCQQRYNAQGGYTSKREDVSQYEFRGVDGEGGNVPEEGTLFGERHQYLSLRAGPDLLETGAPLNWRECLSFLADLPHGYIYVAYFFDYDVTMMIRTMPEDVARRLLKRETRMGVFGAIPVEVGEFEVDYLQHKEFKVRHKGAKHWTVISDVGQFFQASFLKTLERWDIGTITEREMIRKGKSMRAEFSEHTEEIAAYNALECVLLEETMTHFRAVCWETGYVPKKWQGPGHLASAMLSKHGVPKRDDIPIMANETFRLLAQEAYYGGRFETTACGPVPGPVFQYDINGAYVAALKTLPCLIHGSWVHTTVKPADMGVLWFGRVHFTHDKPRYLYNLPVRGKDGNIHYPKEATGVYWSMELAEAQRAGTTISFKDGWVYQAHCSCRWFDFVDDYYAERVRLGKSSKGMVLKLAGNSIYGKLAQSIGYAPWANPVWAGIITATCRAQILAAVSQVPQSPHAYAGHGTYMIATDGIFTAAPIPGLPVSKKLGEWDLTVLDDGIFIVQPGIYFAGAEPKSRGIERGRIFDMRPAFEEAWKLFHDSRGLDHTVKVPVVNFITARQAVARRKWNLAGTWETTDRDISFWFNLKRATGLARWEDGVFRTFPKLGGPDLVSVGYTRQIGGGLVVGDTERYTDIGLQEAERMSAQPDWVEPLLAGMD